jgi:hypothetical protein
MMDMLHCDIGGLMRRASLCLSTRPAAASINGCQCKDSIFPEKHFLPQHTISVLAMMRRVMACASEGLRTP